MKAFKIILIIFFGMMINSSVFGQNIKIPEWIKGTWNNSAESNTNNFEYWTFSNDSIYVIKGFPINKSTRTCLNKRYSDYKTNTETNDSLFRLNFTKYKELVIYEFKLQNVSYSDKPVLTYSFEIDGVFKRQHSTSCNLVLTK
jgi:hypothetical protein